MSTIYRAHKSTDIYSRIYNKMIHEYQGRQSASCNKKTTSSVNYYRSLLFKCCLKIRESIKMSHLIL